MKRPSARVASAFVVSVFSFGTLGVLAGASGCDDDKAKTDPQASASAAMTAAAPVMSATAASASPSASADAPKKKDVVCTNSDTVDTQDQALLAELRKKLGKKPTDAVKVSELPNVKSINLTAVTNLTDLDPCVFPKLTGMHDLFLGPGDLWDLSPIASLNQLITLRASINKVSDLRPLEKLVQLDRLDLGRTAVRDITMVGNLVNLTELSIDETEVRDLAPLASCKKLEKISIKKTQVVDVSPLKNLTKLKYLYIEGAPVTDTSSLQPLVGRGLKIVSSGR